MDDTPTEKGLRAQMMASMLAGSMRSQLRKRKTYYREPRPKTESKAMARRRRQIANGQLKSANGLEVNRD